MPSKQGGAEREWTISADKARHDNVVCGPLVNYGDAVVVVPKSFLLATQQERDQALEAADDYRAEAIAANNRRDEGIAAERDASEAREAGLREALERIAVWEEQKGKDDGPCQGIARAALQDPIPESEATEEEKGSMAEWWKGAAERAGEAPAGDAPARCAGSPGKPGEIAAHTCKGCEDCQPPNPGVTEGEADSPSSVPDSTSAILGELIEALRERSGEAYRNSERRGSSVEARTMHRTEGRVFGQAADLLATRRAQ